MCTFNVYWLVNLRSHPRIRHGNRRLSCWGSISRREGDTSLDGEVLISEGSRLEQDRVGECDVHDLGEWVREIGDHEEEGKSREDVVEKSKLKALV